jgi:hypothetical protein
MRIDSAGNVGIGTSSPNAAMEIARTAADSGFSATGIRLARSNFGGEINGFINQGVSHGLIFSTVDTGTATERMRIDASGNVLVGTTSFAAGSFESANKIGQWCIATKAVNQSGTFFHITFLEGTTQRGGITSNGSSTTYATTSDYRLKENVAPMVGALDIISQLKPVTYSWKENGSEGQGFIAHELQEVVPDAVVGEKDAINEDGSIKPQGIDTSFLVATLTAAIQELNAKVEALEAQLNKE